MYRGLRTDGQGWWKGDLVGDSVIIHGEQEFSVNTIDFGPNVPPFSMGRIEGLKGAIVIPETVGRKTGYTDTSDKKNSIYEGDILYVSYKNEFNNEVAFITTVKRFGKGNNLYTKGYFLSGDEGLTFTFQPVEWAFSFWEFYDASVKIVGTVYDKIFTFEGFDGELNFIDLKEKVTKKLGNYDEGIFHIIIENQLRNKKII